MDDSRESRRALAAAGMESMRRGDVRAARATFERARAEGWADASVLTALAVACWRDGDRSAAYDAVDAALQREPRNLQALIVRGDFMAQSGDTRGAASFYRTAVRSAPPAAQLPAEMRAELDRARRQLEAYGAGFEAHLSGFLASRGYRAGGAHSRFGESLELLFGRQQVQLQHPKVYYFPGLPQVAFYGREAFPWLADLEAATAEIREEARAVLADAAAFRPYVESNAERPHHGQDGMLDNPAWSAFYLWKYGERIDANAARCPATMRAIEKIPQVWMQHRSPTVLFSLLRPGAHIPPHHGMLNTRLIGHLPLIVPGQCTFRVGNEQRDWEEGRAWLFDDTFEHEAWNRSREDRVVMIFETWKPELTEAERALVTSIFEAVDDHSGEKPQWEI